MSSIFLIVSTVYFNNYPIEYIFSNLLFQLMDTWYIRDFLALINLMEISIYLYHRYI